MQNIESFKELLNSPKNIIITTHQKPDADALGSSLGLAGYLLKKGHDVTVITPTGYPNFLNWMQGNGDVINYLKAEAQSHEMVEKADIIFCLDFSSLHRINSLGDHVRASKATKVLIDHHLDPENFADFVSWSTKAAATAELVFELIRDLGDVDLIDKNIAECLYAGIMTDTGMFKHPNTTKNVHLITAELIDLGADISKVARMIYDTNSVNRLKFTGYALSQRLVVMAEYKTAYFAISASDLKKFKYQTGDSEGLVNYALSIKGIMFAALIVEREDMVKLSLRSKGDFPANEVAKNYFEGGGHKNAAGGKSDLSLVETVEKFKKILPEYKEKLIFNFKKEIANVTI